MCNMVPGLGVQPKIDTGYNVGLTLKKSAIPLVLVAIVEAAAQALQQCGVHVDKALIYQAAIGGYAALIGFINWIKNHKKKGIGASA